VTEGLAMACESERRRSRPAVRGFEEILALFESESAAHMSAGPASEGDLARLEEAIGARLPDDFRAFLVRLGGGLYFHGHEIFGPCRVMIHDIEMVPDLASVRERLTVLPGAPPSLFPFHRARGTFNFLDADAPGPVFSGRGERLFPDLASFLDTIVLPRDAAPGPQ
jgi:SMI1 / KNR4 family (SUKH-1)